MSPFRGLAPNDAGKWRPMMKRIDRELRETWERFVFECAIPASPWVALYVLIILMFCGIAYMDEVVSTQDCSGCCGGSR
jgi:hypothetical protein